MPTTTNETLINAELSTFQEDDIYEQPPSDIIAYNELRSCSDLYRMYKQNILNIKPGYQREIVWKNPDQTRFIDSLIKQLPIPSMCFSLDYKTQQWQVIDGLQRMWSIVQFLSGENWILSELDDIDPEISGKPIEWFFDGKPEHERLTKYRIRIENFTLPITVLRCDYTKKSHQEYIFMIFHRLNKLGSKLNNQEIRNCIYFGHLNDLLKELNRNPVWLKINKMKQPEGYRFVKEEIILRFFAFHDRYQQYNGRLARFLNMYMSEFRDPDSLFMLQKRDLFNDTIDVIYRLVFNGKIPGKLSISVLEALLIGVSFNIEWVHIQSVDKVNLIYQKLLRMPEFSPENLREDIANKDKVINRLSKAIEVFSGR